jgi:hypothetical protein
MTNSQSPSSVHPKDAERLMPQFGYSLLLFYNPLTNPDYHRKLLEDIKEGNRDAKIFSPGYHNESPLEGMIAVYIKK